MYKASVDELKWVNTIDLHLGNRIIGCIAGLTGAAEAAEETALKTWRAQAWPDLNSLIRYGKTISGWHKMHTGRRGRCACLIISRWSVSWMGFTTQHAPAVPLKLAYIHCCTGTGSLMAARLDAEPHPSWATTQLDTLPQLEATREHKIMAGRSFVSWQSRVNQRGG